MALLDQYNIQENGEFLSRVASAVAKAAYDIFNEDLPSSVMASDATNGQNKVVVGNRNHFWTGKVVVVSDSSHSEDSTVAQILPDSDTTGTLTMSSNLFYPYTASAGGKVTFKDDAERKDWAKAVLENPDTFSTKMVWTVIQNPTIQSLGPNSTDIDIQYVVNSNLNHFVALYADQTCVDHDQALENKVTNLESIHLKLGAHNQEVQNSLYKRPENLLVFYGWLNSFNSAVNGWSNEKVAQDMAKYGLIIFGDGVQDPTHGDYANTQVIIPRIKALNPSVLIFGYVNAPISESTFNTKVDQWNTLMIHGIFLDEAGYDYGLTRTQLNIKVDYVHSRTSARICFANSWNTDHVLGTANDISYPNTTYNVSLAESHLNENDWILVESFPINTQSWTRGYETVSSWSARAAKLQGFKTTHGINFAGNGIINNDSTVGNDLFNFGYVSALMVPLSAYGTSDNNYAAGSAAVTFWNRPNTDSLNKIWSLSSFFQKDNLDSSKYYRYLDGGRLSLNFNPGSESGLITVYNVSGSGYVLQGGALNQATTTDSQTMYWGSKQLDPQTSALINQMYIPKDGTIKAAYVHAHSETAGTNENWSMYIRLNDTSDTLIQTLGANTASRLWSNTTLNIAVAQGDFIEMKEIQPAWGTNPVNVRRASFIYIE